MLLQCLHMRQTNALTNNATCELITELTMCGIKKYTHKSPTCKDIYTMQSLECHLQRYLHYGIPRVPPANQIRMPNDAHKIGQNSLLAINRLSKTNKLLAHNQELHKCIRPHSMHTYLYKIVSYKRVQK